MQMNVGMLGEECLHPLGLVSRKIVGDGMDLLTPGLVGNDVGE